jgi:hypothetical protein
MPNIAPFSNFYVKQYTASADDPFRLEDNQNIVLKSVNIHVYTNDALYGNSLLQPGTIVANAVIWFDAPIRPFDLIFKNAVAGNNTTIALIGAML